MPRCAPGGVGRFTEDVFDSDTAPHQARAARSDRHRRSNLHHRRATQLQYRQGERSMHRRGPILATQSIIFPGLERVASRPFRRFLGQGSHRRQNHGRPGGRIW